MANVSHSYMNGIRSIRSCIVLLRVCGCHDNVVLSIVSMRILFLFLLHGIMFNVILNVYVPC